MNVPFLDLEAHHRPIRAEIMSAINRVVDQNAFAGGAFVTEFERNYARFCGVDHCVGVGSGTEAIWLALLALGIGAGDEVITSPMTFIAAAEAITFTGAQPVFVDIDASTYTIDPTKIEAAITPRTKAIVPVHLFGQCAEMDAIMAIAKRHKLYVVEDGAQSHGATFRGRPAGTIGHAGATSFYPGKNLGAWGDAGAITTSDSALRDRLLILRDHGQKEKYHHEMVGWNARMDGIQAAVLTVKLKYLDQANGNRRRIAARYNQLLSSCPQIALPSEKDYCKHVYHIYAVRVRNRDQIAATLRQHDVVCGIHYPVPVHLQPAYASLRHVRGTFPVSEVCSDEFLSLPMFPELTDDKISTVVTTLAAELTIV